ncbi:MAG: hypothetical protein ABEI57_01760 [Halapricum sp.]
MNTPIHLTELYDEVLGPSSADTVELSFRSPELAFSLAFGVRGDRRVWTIEGFDGAAVGIAVGPRLRHLASSPTLMLVEHDPEHYVLQTAETDPDRLVEQTDQIAEALDTHRLAVVDVQLHESVRGDLLDRVRGRLVSAGLVDRRTRPFNRV